MTTVVVVVCIPIENLFNLLMLLISNLCSQIIVYLFIISVRRLLLFLSFFPCQLLFSFKAISFPASVFCLELSFWLFCRCSCLSEAWTLCDGWYARAADGHQWRQRYRWRRCRWCLDHRSTSKLNIKQNMPQFQLKMTLFLTWIKKLLGYKKTSFISVFF